MSYEVRVALFKHAVTRKQVDFDLASAVLVLGQIEYGEFEIENYISQIDTWTKIIRDRAGALSNATKIIEAMRWVLFEDIGLKGDDEDYFDIRNGFLHQVIDRRLGIPLSLAVLVAIVCEKLDVDFDILGKAGSFFVRFRAEDFSIVIDPDDRGAVVGKAELVELFGSATPSKTEFGFEPRQLVRRMLTHLGLLYGRMSEDQKHLEIIEHLLILDKGDNTILANLRNHLLQKLAEVN